MRASADKGMAREITTAMTDLAGGNFPFGSGHLVTVANREADRRGRPELAADRRFLARVAIAEADRLSGLVFELEDDRGRGPGAIVRERAQAQRDIDRRANGQAARNDARERERVKLLAVGKLPVVAGSPDHKTIAREILRDVGRGRSGSGIGSGRLVKLSIDEARRRGQPELATDPRLLKTLARRQFEGQLGGTVLDEF